MPIAHSGVNKTLGPYEIEHLEAQCSLALFLELVQGVQHRLAGNPDQSAKGLIQLRDQKNSTRNRERRDCQSENSSSIGRRKHAETEENNDEP